MRASVTLGFQGAVVRSGSGLRDDSGCYWLVITRTIGPSDKFNFKV